MVSCQVPARSVRTWIFSTMRLMLFFDGRWPRRAFPVLAERQHHPAHRDDHARRDRHHRGAFILIHGPLLQGSQLSISIEAIPAGFQPIRTMGAPEVGCKPGEHWNEL